ncbi:MAG: transposase [Gaiellales bacterium]
MSRPRRHDHGARPLHVVARAVARDVLFPDPSAFSMFWTALGEQAREHDVTIGQICLMTNHYHLLVRGHPDDLAETLKMTHGRLAWLRNKDDQRRGRVFGRRYDVFPIDGVRHHARVVRYIPHNPVAAGMCDDPAGWKWSTHRILAGHEPPPDWLDLPAALRLAGFFDSRSYERLVLRDTPLEIPPMTTHELMTHRICTMAADGAPEEVIEQTLGVSARRIRSTTKAAGIELLRRN